MIRCLSKVNPYYIKPCKKDADLGVALPFLELSLHFLKIFAVAHWTLFIELMDLMK